MRTEQGVAIVSPTSPIPSDPRSYARELGEAHASQVAFHRRHLGMSPQEADAAATNANALQTEYVETSPADQVSWIGLSSVMAANPELVQRTLDRIRAEADDELRSGNRAAKAVESGGSPWKRAQFLALVNSLGDDWRPRSGIERMLIDTLAQAQTEYLIWMERLHGMTVHEAARVDKRIRSDGEWTAPRVRDAEAFTQAMDMVDRFNRLIMRTVRTLKDLRRTPSAVVVQQADQINVARQQVNVSRQSDAGDCLTGGYPGRLGAAEDAGGN